MPPNVVRSLRRSSRRTLSQPTFVPQEAVTPTPPRTSKLIRQDPGDDDYGDDGDDTYEPASPMPKRPCTTPSSTLDNTTAKAALSRQNQSCTVGHWEAQMKNAFQDITIVNRVTMPEALALDPHPDSQVETPSL